MANSTWNETTAPGRLRVFRVEIDRPNNGETVARFHLERLFEDPQTLETLATRRAGAWVLPLSEALASPTLAPLVGPVAVGLENLAEHLYQTGRAVL